MHLLMPVNQFKQIVMHIVQDARIKCDFCDFSLRILQPIAEMLMKNHIESLFVQLASRSGKTVRMSDIETLQLNTSERWNADARRSFVKAGTLKLHSKGTSVKPPGSDFVTIAAVKAATGKVKCVSPVYRSLRSHWAKIIGSVVKAAAESSGTRGRLTVADAAAVLRSEAFTYAGYTHLAESQISITPSFQMMRRGSEACLAVEDGPAGREEKEHGETKEVEEGEKEVNEKGVESDEG